MFVHWNAPEAVNLAIVGTSVAFSAVGFVVALAIYKAGTLKWNESIAKGAPMLYNFSYNRWYMDDVYHGAAKFLLKVFSGIWTLVDSMIIDDFKDHKVGVVNLVPSMVRGMGRMLTKSENGRGQYYALVIFAGVAIITLVVYFLRPGG